jgi:hypothetical protein
MMGNNYLLAREGMPPLVMAAGSADLQKAVMAKNSDRVV